MDRKRYEESLAREVLSFDEEKEPGYWVKLAEELEKDPDRAPTDEQRARFKKRLAAAVAESQDQKILEAMAAEEAKQKKFRLLRNVAVAAIFLCAIVGTTLYSTVDTFAAGVNRFFTTVISGDKEMRLEERQNVGIDLDVAEFEGMYIPGWIPNGYHLVEYVSMADEERITYKDGNDKVILYHIYTETGSLWIDDEKMSTTPIYVHDTWGEKIQKDSILYLVWEDGEHVYMVSGDSKDEDILMKIIEKSTKVSLEE